MSIFANILYNRTFVPYITEGSFSTRFNNYKLFNCLMHEYKKINFDLENSLANSRFKPEDVNYAN